MKVRANSIMRPPKMSTDGYVLCSVWWCGFRRHATRGGWGALCQKHTDRFDTYGGPTEGPPIDKTSSSEPWYAWEQPEELRQRTAYEPTPG